MARIVYIYAIYDRIFSDSLPKIPFTHCINMVLANLTYEICDR